MHPKPTPVPHAGPRAGPRRRGPMQDAEDGNPSASWLPELPRRRPGRREVVDLVTGDPVVDRAAGDSHQLTRLRDREGCPISNHDRRSSAAAGGKDERQAPCWSSPAFEGNPLVGPVAARTRNAAFAGPGRRARRRCRRAGSGAVLARREIALRRGPPPIRSANRPERTEHL